MATSEQSRHAVKLVVAKYTELGEALVAYLSSEFCEPVVPPTNLYALDIASRNNERANRVLREYNHLGAIIKECGGRYYPRYERHQVLDDAQRRHREFSQHVELMKQIKEEMEEVLVAESDRYNQVWPLPRK
jgi:hypothetical protein